MKFFLLSYSHDFVYSAQSEITPLSTILRHLWATSGMRLQRGDVMCRTALSPGAAAKSKPKTCE
jgi:hypothetical protein